MNWCRFVVHQKSSILFSTFQFDCCIKYVISFFVYMFDQIRLLEETLLLSKVEILGVTQIPVTRCASTCLLYKIGMHIISGLIIVCMQVKMSTVVNMEAASITCCAVSVESSVAAQLTLLSCRLILSSAEFRYSRFLYVSFKS